MYASVYFAYRYYWYAVRSPSWHSQRDFENNVSKACIMMVFETIWNCRQHIENNVSKACILTVFEMIWNCRDNFENNVSKACILMVFEMSWNCRESNGNNRYITSRVWNNNMLCRSISLIPSTVFSGWYN